MAARHTPRPVRFIIFKWQSAAGASKISGGVATLRDEYENGLGPGHFSADRRATSRLDIQCRGQDGPDALEI